MSKQFKVITSTAALLMLAFMFVACGGSSGGGGGPIEITSISEIGTIDTGDAIDVAAYGDKLYYIGWANTDASFGIIDFSDPTSPSIMSTLNAGSAYGVAFDGRYAYVETDGSGDGIFTDGTVGAIDCLDPNNPVGVDENDLGYYSAYDVELSGDYLYNFSYDIIGVYDVSSPAGSVNFVRNVDTSEVIFGRAVGDYLYVGSEYDLVIYDISDPATMVTEVGRVTVSDSTTYGATASGSTAFIAGEDAGEYYIYSVDISSPSTPAVLGSVPTDTFIYYEMRVLGDYLLAVGDDEFVVIDISDPANMVLVDSVTMGNGYGWGFDISGKYAVVGDDTVLRIIQLY